MNRPVLQEGLLSYTLGFVLLWFGVNELFFPSLWISYVPQMFGNAIGYEACVVIHAAILVISAVFLFFNVLRSLGGLIAMAFAIEVILTALFREGVTTTVAALLPLFGASACIALSRKASTNSRITTSGAPGIFPERYK